MKQVWKTFGTSFTNCLRSVFSASAKIIHPFPFFPFFPVYFLCQIEKQGKVDKRREKGREKDGI